MANITLESLGLTVNQDVKILDFNGLTINIENSIEKIKKKCDIIIDINQKINEEVYK